MLIEYLHLLTNNRPCNAGVFIYICSKLYIFKINQTSECFADFELCAVFSFLHTKYAKLAEIICHISEVNVESVSDTV